jgi:hypothetical protein
MTSSPLSPNITSLPGPPSRTSVGLVRHSAGLNRRVVLAVIVESDEELRPFGAVDQRRLRGMRRAENQARARDEQAGRERTL